MLGKIIACLFGFLAGGVVVLLIKIKKTRKKINLDLQKIAVGGLTNEQRAKVELIVLNKRRLYKKQNKGVVWRGVLGLKKKKSKFFRPILTKVKHSLPLRIRKFALAFPP